MKKAITLTCIEFDNLENRDPYRQTVIGTFTDGDKLTAHGKVAKYMESLPPHNLYLGYDGKVYPQYVLEEIVLR